MLEKEFLFFKKEPEFKQKEVFEKEKQELSKIENLEKNSERLAEFLKLVDRYTFPENPLNVKIGKFKKKI